MDMWKFLIVVKFLVGHWFFFFGMEIFLACDLSWNNELNFRVAEPQESR